MQEQEKQISLVSAGVDGLLTKYSLQKGKKFSDLDPFELKSKDQSDYKLLSVDITRQKEGLEDKIVTGHEKLIVLREAENLKQIWEKHPDPKKQVSADFIRVKVDETGEVIAVSGTDRNVMLFDSTGKLLCKCSCGEIVTGILFSENKRHLITCSSSGVIYIWKLPHEVTKLMTKPVEELKKRLSREVKPIVEEEFEQSIPQALKNKPESMPIHDEMKHKLDDSNVLNTVNDVLAQIGQVTQQVENIENSEKFVPKKEDVGDQGAPDNQKTPQTLFNKGSNMPRWALSVVQTNSQVDKSNEQADDSAVSGFMQ